MTSWGEKMASVVTACGPRPTHSGLPYHRRLEKVKFGVPLEQVCKRDTIPGPLLVMLLKINKEGPFKKDVFRAPGHMGNTRKLIHFLQQGRLVNIHSFSVNTIASVLKKFLRKIPGGVFGPENEALLFSIESMTDEDEKLRLVKGVFHSLPVYSQHLLVLLFGTFRVIHSNSQRAKTGMTAEAIGVSVAPSFFHTCVTEGKIAKPCEVQKFKVATKITTFFIEHFGMRDLYGRENYEYYARLTGRILKVEDEWIFFAYPPVAFGSSDAIDEAGRQLAGSAEAVACAVSDDDLSRRAGESRNLEKSGSLEIIPENCPLDPNGRLSISLDDKNMSSPSSCGSQNQLARHAGQPSRPAVDTSVVVRRPQRGHEVKSYTCLPQWDPNRRHSMLVDPAAKRLATSSKVHQRQTERMRHRSEWFLSDPTGLVTVKCRPSGVATAKAMADRPSTTARPQKSSLLSETASTARTSSSSSSMGRLSPKICDMPFACISASTTAVAAATATAKTRASHDVQRLRRKLSDKDKERRLVRRSSSKRKDKENGDSAETVVTSSATSDPASGDSGMRGSLKRTGSAEVARQQSGHALLCRTGSQDTPHASVPGEETGALTRSLPRI